MPKGIYGRMIMILLLPVIGVQVIVSIVFIQRHFEDVTKHMSANIAREIQVIADLAQPHHNLADALGFTVAPAEQVVTRRGRFDISGHYIAQVFAEIIPNFMGVDLCGSVTGCQQRTVMVYIRQGDGLQSYSFARDRVSATNPHQLLVIMIALSSVLSLIAFVYLRNQLRPISHLSKAATAYGKGQITPYRIRGATEIRTASAAFIDMRNRIERQNQTRQQMLSGISHDLRTPLTRMRLALEFEDGPHVQDMQADVADMQAMLDAFLDYMRDGAEEQTTLHSPRDLIHDAVRNGARSGADIQLECCAQVEPLPLRLMGMRRALANLITNATRYGQQVRVSLIETPKVLRFCVEDDGPGIPESARAEMRRPFVRLDPARNQNQGAGVGLGLSIVEDVARAHGGRLELADSTTLGGLRASLIIPK